MIPGRSDGAPGRRAGPACFPPRPRPPARRPDPGDAAGSPLTGERPTHRLNPEGSGEPIAAFALQGRHLTPLTGEGLEEMGHPCSGGPFFCTQKSSREYPSVSGPRSRVSGPRADPTVGVGRMMPTKMGSACSGGGPGSSIATKGRTTPFEETDHPVWGDPPPCLGRPTTLFEETDHPVWGDPPPCLGRPTTLFEETDHPVWGDPPPCLGRRFCGSSFRISLITNDLQSRDPGLTLNSC
jgi:hypothetical protein